MANILKFPEQHGTTDIRDFLQDDDYILHFGPGAIQQKSVSAKEPSKAPASQNWTSRDWTNQELANLFRVKSLLNTAGVPSDVERGLTDEGDPWFIFCDGQGEVFIHLCRINQIYLLDSPNLTQPLTGRDFNDLIDSFTQTKSLPKTDVDDATGSAHRIIKFKRGGRVFLHPATMLAALVWTLLLDSEDIIMVLPDNEENSGDSLIQFSESLIYQINEDNLQELEAPSPGLGKASGDHVLPDKAELGDGNQHYFNIEKLNQNSYGLGLSLIAISLGFVSEAQAPEIDDAALGSLLSLLGLNETAESYKLLETAGLNLSEIPDFLSSLQDVFKDLPVLSEKAAEDNEALLSGHLVANFLLSPIEGEESISAFKDIIQETQGKVIPDVGLNEGEFGTEAVEVEEPLGSDVALTGLSNENTDNTGAQISKYSLSELYSLHLSADKYMVNNIEVTATFEIGSNNLEQTTSLIDTSENSHAAKEHQEFGTDAIELISFFVDSNDDIELISMEGEMILFDLSVLNSSPEDRMTMSWSLQNGDLITMVGLKDDYEAFDLTA